MIEKMDQKRDLLQRQYPPGPKDVHVDTLIVYIQNLLYTTEVIENVIATRYRVYQHECFSKENPGMHMEHGAAKIPSSTTSNRGVHQGAIRRCQTA